MTNTVRIKLITAGLIVASSILAYGDKLTAIPGIPGWLAHLWPFAYSGALLFRELAHVFWPDIAPPASVLPDKGPLSGVALTSNNPKP